MSGERTREPAPAIAEVEASASVPRDRDPNRLLELIGLAVAADGKEQVLLAGDINAVLIAMRAPGNEAAEAKTILSQLDLKTLDGLKDAQNRKCQAEAVETLLACGFPHALAVQPEDATAHRVDREWWALQGKRKWWQLGLLVTNTGLLPALGQAGAFGGYQWWARSLGFAVWVGYAVVIWRQDRAARR